MIIIESSSEILLAPVKYGTPMLSDEYSSGVKSVPEVNEIIFHKFLKYDNILEVCEGYGYQHEKHFHCVGEQCDFSIRLVPVRTDYSYVHIYYRE